jgi:hypothetical protein
LSSIEHPASLCMGFGLLRLLASLTCHPGLTPVTASKACPSVKVLQTFCLRSESA